MRGASACSSRLPKESARVLAMAAIASKSSCERGMMTEFGVLGTIMWNLLLEGARDLTYQTSLYSDLHRSDCSSSCCLDDVKISG